MSFFKAVGRVVGGFLGARTGQSAQDRKYNEDWHRQHLIEAGQFAAQKEALEGQQRIQGFWDQATDELTKQLQAEARMDETKVELGSADPTKRRFFRIGS